MSTAKLDDSTQRPLYGERIIEESKIICFENPNKKRIYEISIQLPEFTCKCPFSGYPDFAKLNIIYQPNLRVYELKSLKLYINNFRDMKISHEEVVNRIMDDLVNAGSPHWIHLNAAFNPRGNVSMKLDIFSGQKKNYLLTINNEKGPIKISNINDFSENFAYLNSSPIKINSSDFSLKQIIPSSGLIIKNDPSIPFIYFSFILIIFGTIISLIPTKQLWILVNKECFKLSDEIKNF